MGKKPISGWTLAIMRLLLKIFTHQYTAFILRLYIAGLFIIAGMYKINYTAEFSETIASYQLVPYWAVNVMAVTLPWIELICGILLAAGIRAKSATVIIGILLIVFTLGLLINLLRGSPISCGCFSTLGDKISWKTFFRDLAWICMTVHIFLYDKVLHLERRFLSVFKEI